MQATNTAATVETLPSWEEMSELEQLSCIWWDAYKDAHGFRPRGTDTSAWTVEMFKAEIEHLADVIDREEKLRLEDEAHAARRLEDRIAATILQGAGDRATAIRWIADAEGANGDMEYLCYLLGVKYGYFKEAA